MNADWGSSDLVMARDRVICVSGRFAKTLRSSVPLRFKGFAFNLCFS